MGFNQISPGATAVSTVNVYFDFFLVCLLRRRIKFDDAKRRTDVDKINLFVNIY